MLEGIRSSKVSIVFVAAISIFTDSFMYGLVQPVLPYALVRRTEVAQKDVQFWITAFMAVWAAFILVGSVFFGWLGERGLSKRWLFVVSQIILGLSTAMFMVARHIPLMLVARILQGFSGGGINTLGYTLTFDAVGQDQIGIAIGYVTTGLSLGIFFGPIVGGPLYDYAGYEWVFIPMIILIVIEIIMRVSLIEPPPRMEQAVSSERARLLGDDSNNINNSPQAPNGLVRSKSGGARLRRSSIGDPTKIFTKGARGSPVWILLTNRRFAVAMFNLFIACNFTGALDSTLPIFGVDQLHFSSTKVALLILAMTCPEFFGPLAGWLVDKIGPKWPAAAGFVVGGIALLLMRFTETDTPSRIPILIVLLILVGVSLTLLWGPSITEVSLAVEELEHKSPGIFGEHGALSLAFGLQNAAFGAGAMVGPIYSGAILVNSGWAAMTTVLGVISLVTTIPVVLYTGGDLFPTNSSKHHDDSVLDDDERVPQ